MFVLILCNLSSHSSSLLINYSVVKFWDTRNLKSAVAQASSDAELPTQKVSLEDLSVE